MALKELNINDSANEFVSNDAVVLCMGKDGKVNPIAIGWKTLGILWSRSVIVIAVHPSRYSFQLLEKGEQAFTVNIGGSVNKYIDYCGTHSGKKTDKIKEGGIELIPGTKTKIPVIKGAHLSYECKIIHKTDSGKITLHNLYFGEILAAHIQD